MLSKSFFLIDMECTCAIAMTSKQGAVAKQADQWFKRGMGAWQRVGQLSRTK